MVALPSQSHALVDHRHRITSDWLEDDAVTSAKIAADAVGASEIAANAVGSSELADNSVDTNAIQDNAVTNPKMADNSVNTAEIVNDAVTQAKLALNYVAGNHSDSLSATSAESGTVTFGVTFSAAPVVVGTVDVGSNADLVLNWTNPPGTTSVSYRVATRNGGSITVDYDIQWVAIGVLA
jgi:hypothetical protein